MSDDSLSPQKRPRPAKNLQRLREEALTPEGKIDWAKVDNSLALRRWLRSRQRGRKAGELSEEEIRELDAIGMEWDRPLVGRDSPANWEKKLRQVAEVVENTRPQGWDEINQFFVRRWLVRQQKRLRSGELPPEQKEKIDAVIPFDWTEPPPRRVRPSAKWEARLAEYLKLANAPGGLPRRGELPPGMRIWIDAQRDRRRKGRMAESTIRRLDEAGFDWEPADLGVTSSWWKYYDKLAGLLRDKGALWLSHQDPEERELGIWLTNQRRAWREGRLKPVQTEALEKVGLRMETGAAARWRARFDRLKGIAERHGGRIPAWSELPSAMTKWLYGQRNKRRDNSLEPWQIAALDSIGMTWEPQPQTRPSWHEHYELLKDFWKKHGHTHVLSSMDPVLGRWVNAQRERYQRGQMLKDEELLLREIGFEFKVRDKPRPEWMAHYRSLEKFHKKHGHSRVPRAYPANPGLAEFVAQQKQRRQKGRLTPHHIELLDRLDFPWVTRPKPKTRTWMEDYRALEAFHREHGHTRVPSAHDKKLQMWATRQRLLRREGRLKPEQIALLDKLGYDWVGQPSRQKKNKKSQHRA